MVMVVGMEGVAVVSTDGVIVKVVVGVEGVMVVMANVGFGFSLKDDEGCKSSLK